MDFGLGILTFGTIGGVGLLAYFGAKQTAERRKAGGPKSSLAADGPKTAAIAAE